MIKKIIFTLLALSMTCQVADAQFLKKLFKKKAKTEKRTKKNADGIDDNAQVAMADIATLTDNTNNRNAFMGIPLGIKADTFEKLLLEKGFAERKQEGNHTAKSYIYDGEAYGARATVTLAVSDNTDRVYAVDVTDETIYPSLKEVKARFAQVKSELLKTYGRGYVDNQGEAYTIQTQLGTVNLHYERGSLTSSYTLGFALDDAKAYQMAYAEMDDKEYETAPRNIETGLAAACNHTDLVGLGVLLLQNRTVKGAQTVLANYDYTLGKATAKALTASFKMNSYQATASLARKKQAITAITLTATDDAEAVCKDLKTNGFTSSDQKTWRQGKMTAVVTTNAQQQVVVTLR
jgi:predicted RNA binding protein YcfA (HicA-like mRNA interferase family)